MTDMDSRKITERLTKLERENRNLRRFVIASILVCGMGLFVWSALGHVKDVDAEVTARSKQANIIEAEGFVLVDSKGNARAELSLGKDGPNLRFFESDGKLRACLSGSQLALSFGRDGKLPSKLADGLSFYDKTGQHRLVMQPGNGLRFYDSAGKESVLLMTGNGLRLSDSEGAKSLYLVPGNGLRLSDSEGAKSLYLVPGNGLRLYDEGEKLEVLLQAGRLGFRDEKGSWKWFR